MSKLKIAGLLVLGGILGQVLLVAVKVLVIVREVKSPGFLVSATLPSAAPRAMSNEELGIWNAMRDKIRHQKYTEVNALIRFVEQDVAFEVVPAKSVFSPGESILAEMRIKNLSNRPLHVNEPQEQKLTPDSYFYKGMNQFDYDVSINPTRSTWMRTLQTGEVLRLPTLILTTNVGPHKINYSLSVSEFQPGSSDQYAPTIKRASCEFTVQPENDQARQTDSPH